MSKRSVEYPFKPDEVVSFNQAFMEKFLSFMAVDANDKVIRSGGNYKHTVLIYDLVSLNQTGGLQLAFNRMGSLGAEQGDLVIAFDSNIQQIKPTNCSFANTGDDFVIADCLFLSGIPKKGEQVQQLRSIPAPKVEYKVYNGGNLIEHQIQMPDKDILAYRYHYVGSFEHPIDTVHAWLYCSKPIRRDGNSREPKILFQALKSQLFGART